MDPQDLPEDRLDGAVKRRHPLMVIIPLLALIAALALIYRYAGVRWPGNATGHGAVDISETDVSRGDNAHVAVLRHGAGAAPAAGFHKAAATGGE
jgi:hypothetical protein